MELDTGTTCIMIPKSQYKLTWPIVSKRPRLISSHISLNSYGAFLSRLRVKLICSCLLVRNLIGRLGLIKDIHKVSNNANVCLGQEFQKLFSGGFGCYKCRKFNIKVDQPVSPKYYKVHRVPYILRAKIDEDLNRLLKEGIIFPITHS